MSRGLALIESLRKLGDKSEINVIALDDKTFQSLNKIFLYNCKIHPLESIYSSYPEITSSMQGRSKIEIYFTLTPFFIDYIFRSMPDNDCLIYLDADLYFFEKPNFELFSSHSSIFIIPHILNLKHRFKFFKFGIFNVGCIGFKKDSTSNSAILWWRDSCLNWCYDRVEKDRFADQKYLDFFPILFEGVNILQNPGLNVAPWNLKYSNIKFEQGSFWVDVSHKLIFYHFHGLKIFKFFYLSNLYLYSKTLLSKDIRYLYSNYIETMRQIEYNFAEYLPNRVYQFSRQKGKFKLFNNFLLNLITFNALYKK